MLRVSLAFLVLLPSLARSQDRVTYLDRSSKTGNTLLRTGSVTTEDPGKVTVSSADNRRTDIPVSDVIDVLYEGEPLAEMNAARAAERDRKYDAALAGYTDALRKVTADRRLLRRHLEFKIAEMRASQADSGANAAPAIEALRAFTKAHSDGRQCLAALDHLARLLIASDQPATEVNNALAQVRARFGADNKDVACRCDLLRSDFLLQELEQTLVKQGLAAAKSKAVNSAKSISELTTIADRSIQPDIAARLAFCQAFSNPASAFAAWDTQLKNTEDPHSRASIHLARGDYYRLVQNFKEAMWDYLWVDTVYFSDRTQQAKALYHLIDVFDKLGDSAKSRESKDRLQNDGRLRDTRYPKLIR